MVERAPVGDVVDDIPIGRFHWLVMGILGSVWAAMGVSVLGISFTLPTFIETWNLSGFTAGVLGSASLVGMILGNSLGGRYADRAGRKRTLVAGVVTFSVFTALTGLAVGFYTAVGFRLLTGVGLGGTLVAGASYVTEHMPSITRGRSVTYLEACFSLGSFATVAVAWLVLSELSTDGTLWGVDAWRIFFAIGIAPVVLAAFVYLYLPESPYYLAESGDLDAAMARLEAMARYNGDDVAGLPDALRPPESGTGGFSRLFDSDLARTTALMVVLWFSVNLAYYGIFTWLPDTIATAGYVESLYTYLFAVAAFQLLGQLSGAYLIEVVGRKWTLGSLLVVGGLATFVFAVAIPDGGAAGGETLFSVGVFAMGFALFGAWAVLYAYTSEVFPTKVRSTGLGLTGSVGKVAATLGPVVFGTLAQFGYLVALAPVTVLLVATGLALLAFGRETRGETLS
ncbi:MAG: MFS transporter [Haloarculaceae archaeon]